MIIDTATRPTPSISSVALGGDTIELTWSDGLRQQIQRAYLRHSPGFPGGELEPVGDFQL